MNFRVDPVIKNQEPLYEFYKSGWDNPHKWIWFPQYKVGSRTIETQLNKTMCNPEWKKLNNPDVGYNRYQNCLFSDKSAQFNSDKPIHEQWRCDEWTPANPVCKTPAPFDQNDQPHHYFKFSFVRNPFDRVVSCWSDKRYSKGKQQDSIESTLSFEQYVDHLKQQVDKIDGDVGKHGNPHVRSQAAMIQGVDLDFIGKLEHFDRDWTVVRDRMSVGLFEEGAHKNKSERAPDYRQYYTNQTKQIVSEIYATDLDTFGYMF